MICRNRLNRPTAVRGALQGVRCDDEASGLCIAAVWPTRHAYRHSSVARFRTFENGLGILKECIMKT